MLVFTMFVCCGGRRFIYMPLLGVLEARFASLAAGGALLVMFMLYLLRRFAIFVVLASSVLAAATFQWAVSTTGNEAGVHGWLRAVEMSKVDAESLAVRQWSSDFHRRSIHRGETSDEQGGHGFDLSMFETPQRLTVLSVEEAAAAAKLLLSDSDGWIHMDRRAGPLPAFIYGTYYQYNSHGTSLPTVSEVHAARDRWLREGPPGPFQGHRATSTISYVGEHGVQAYNHRQRALWGQLNVPEKLRLALENATGMPVVYDPQWGLPGVQITFSHRVFEYPVFQVLLCFLHGGVDTLVALNS